MFKHLDIMTRRRLRQIAWAIGKAVMRLPVMSDATFTRCAVFAGLFGFAAIQGAPA